MEPRIYTLILLSVIRKLEVLVVVLVLFKKEIAASMMIRWVLALRETLKEIATAGMIRWVLALRVILKEIATAIRKARVRVVMPL